MMALMLMAVGVHAVIMILLLVSQVYISSLAFVMLPYHDKFVFNFRTLIVQLVSLLLHLK